MIPAAPYSDGLRRIRPAHVIRTNGPDVRRTEPEPYRTLADEADASLIPAGGISRHGLSCWCRYCKTDVPRVERLLASHEANCSCCDCQSARRARQ